MDTCEIDNPYDLSDDEMYGSIYLEEEDARRDRLSSLGPLIEDYEKSMNEVLEKAWQIWRVLHKEDVKYATEMLHAIIEIEVRLCGDDIRDALLLEEGVDL